jgi:hypothetical protein
MLNTLAYWDHLKVKVFTTTSFSSLLADQSNKLELFPLAAFTANYYATL